MKLLDFTIIKLTLFLVIGICLASFIKIPLNYTFFFSGFFILALFISFIISKNQFIKTIWFGLLAFLTMISIGVLTVNFHDEKNFESHYSKFISSENNTNTIIFKIKEVLKPTSYHDKYVVSFLNLNDEFVLGKLLLNIEKDSTVNALNVDDRFQLKTTLTEINTPLNPHQFNYKNYLAKQYIYHQVYSKNSSLFKLNSNTQTVFGLAANLRENINLKLKKSDFNENELAIINALLLGQRQDINKEIYNNYTKAGAIHILAVSGLHVGIILLFLSFVFKPIEKLKHGKIIKTILIIIMLWCFAIVAGLSASVTRAVTMFSIISIGLQFKRATNMFNTVAISMFILLLFKPMFLFDVGFQLSYAAVFAIVSFYPLLYKLIKPKYYIFDKFWQVFVVTIAAQFGVVPLSLFYFHQFPGLFFLSNLIIVPLLGFILGFGIIVILLALLNTLPSFLANIYGNIISLMNDFVEWVSLQEEFLIKDISFRILFVVASYLIIIALVNLLKRRNFSRLAFLLIAILFGQGVLIHNKMKSNT
ncbi:competence protein ComEC family protein, partial [Desulfosarcina sp.]|nr:competence protein ComEC family protein [Desulfosarcina sp.]